MKRKIPPKKAVKRPAIVQPQAPSSSGQQKIYSITEGTVIDHVPAGQALRVLQVLGISHKTDLLISLGMNLSSRKRGTKDIVKIDGKLLTKDELSKLALVAPGATVNHISKGHVKDKFPIEIPSVFIGIAQCQNPNCISRHQAIPSRFITVQQKPLQLSCGYCERLVEHSQIVLL